MHSSSKSKITTRFRRALATPFNLVLEAKL